MRGINLLRIKRTNNRFFTHSLTYIHTLTHSLTHSHTHTHIHTNTLTHTHSHTLTHIHTHSHTLTLTYTHTHIHIYIYTHTLTHSLTSLLTRSIPVLDYPFFNMIPKYRESSYQLSSRRTRKRTYGCSPSPQIFCPFENRYRPYENPK